MVAQHFAKLWARPYDLQKSWPAAFTPARRAGRQCVPGVACFYLQGTRLSPGAVRRRRDECGRPPSTSRTPNWAEIKIGIAVRDYRPALGLISLLRGERVLTGNRTLETWSARVNKMCFRLEGLRRPLTPLCLRALKIVAKLEPRGLPAPASL